MLLPVAVVGDSDNDDDSADVNSDEDFSSFCFAVMGTRSTIPNPRVCHESQRPLCNAQVFTQANADT